MEEKIRWAWREGLIAALIIAVLIILGVVIAGLAFGFPGWAITLLVLGTAVATGVWVWSGFVVVGGEPVRHVAIKTTFAKPKSLLRTGLGYCVRPIQKLWRVPAGKYYWQYVVEGNTKDGWWTKLVIRVDFNWPTPNPDDPSEDPDTEIFPFRTGNELIASRGLSWEEAAEENITTWPKKSSWFLLRRAYYRFPKEPMKTTVEELQEYFRGPICGAILTILGERERDQFIEQQEKIEAAVKVMALSEPGDPLVDCGIPGNVLNIKILRVEPTTTGAKESIEAPRRAEKEGAAHQTRKAYEKKAAPDEAERISALVEAYMGKGVDPTTAAILANAQVKGEEFSMEKLMMLGIIKGEFGGQGLSSKEHAAIVRQK